MAVKLKNLVMGRQERATQSRAVQSTALGGVLGGLMIATMCAGVSHAQLPELALGEAVNITDVRLRNIETNQEQEPRLAATEVKSGTPFNIMVDGVPIFGDVQVAAHQDDQRTTDVGLDAMDIQVQFDPEQVDRAANVTSAYRTVDSGRDKLQFFTYWNYGAFIENAEIRLFRADKSVDATPLAVIPVTPGKAATWPVTDEFGRELQYVLRLTGKEGKFDETEPKLLEIGGGVVNDRQDVLREALAAYGKNTLTTKNIDVSGGTVTVFGENVPAGHRVFVMGIPVPVSTNSDFVIEEILPGGHHNVTIAALDKDDRGLEFQRNVYIPVNKFFYVGLGDLTIGGNRSSGPIELTQSEEGNDVDVVGRAAFFLRGKIRGKYLLTAMLDTDEQDLTDFDNFFTGIVDKDPRKLLERVDPDKYYPVYGDDSTTSNLAPTQGKLFVKLERGDSYVMWGNYQTNIVGSDFAQINRSFYGAHLKYGGFGQTSFGEKRVKAEAFAAKPGTLTQAEQQRGTGGSIYFLKRQDLGIQSEKVRVTVRDNTTGVVLSSRQLVRDEDYDIDYIQGRIILFDPLASTADDDFIVSNGSLDGLPQYLEVAYEYTPAAAEIDGYALGGRAEGWLGDYVKIGGTVSNDDADGLERRIYEVDVTARVNAGTYIKGEFARTEGVAYDSFSSLDGGYSLENSTTGIGGEANGYRVEAAVDLAEVGMGPNGGLIGGYYQNRDAGFSAPGQETADEVADYGLTASVPVGEFVKLRGQYSVKDNITQSQTTTTAKADAKVQVGDIGAGLGLGYTDDSTSGSRVDIGGELRFTRENYEAYVFAQTTVANDASIEKNARYGAGGKIRLNDRLSIGGELSGGDAGVGARVSGEYQHSDRTNMYLAYELPNRTSGGQGSSQNASASTSFGTLTFGGRSRLTDALSVYGEERMTFDNRGANGVTHAYGVKYAPSDDWTFTAGGEYGNVKDTDGNALKRMALSGSAGFASQGIDLGAALELRRDEDEAANEERTTYVGKLRAGLKFNPSWRMQAKLNVVLTEANANLGDGDFIDGSVGFAYRPVKGDRLNALFYYRGYYDLPTEDVLNSADTGADYKQRSHIVSADMIYQLTKQISIGAKYGLKYGERTSSRTDDDWRSETAQLGVLRADLHVVRDWDATVELRGLHVSEIQSTRIGALAAVYRHFGENLKVGVGYNFSDISDDLTDLDARTQGFFVNAVTKF